MEKCPIVALLYICLYIDVTFGQQTGLISNDKSKEETPSRFSIGLGVLSPSYSQKFGDDGKMKLDFNQEKGGYSYSLSNVVHPPKSTEQPSYKSNAERKESNTSPSATSASSISTSATNINNNVDNHQNHQPNHQSPSQPNYGQNYPGQFYPNPQMLYHQRLAAAAAAYGASPYAQFYRNPYLPFGGGGPHPSPYYSPPFQGVSATHGNLQTQQAQQTTNTQVQQPYPYAGQNPYLGQFGTYGHGMPYSGLYGAGSSNYPLQQSSPYAYNNAYQNYPYQGYGYNSGPQPHPYLSSEALNAFRQMYASGSENVLSAVSPYSNSGFGTNGGFGSSYGSSYGSGSLGNFGGLSGLGGYRSALSSLNPFSGLTRLFG